MKSRALTPETRHALLAAAWAHILTRGRVDLSLAEIARAAGFTRQSLYLAFGNRTGLLIAMARHADAISPHSEAMRALVRAGPGTPETLARFVRAWLAHLPEIYPVGVLLGAAAVTDPEAAEVFRDRMIGGLHAGYLALLARLAAAGHLRPGLTAERAADLCWSLTHIDAWRQLVVERGWTPAEFTADRLALTAAVLAEAPPSGSDPTGS